MHIVIEKDVIRLMEDSCYIISLESAEPGKNLLEAEQFVLTEQYFDLDAVAGIAGMMTALAGIREFSGEEAEKFFARPEARRTTYIEE